MRPSQRSGQKSPSTTDQVCGDWFQHVRGALQHTLSLGRIGAEGLGQARCKKGLGCLSGFSILKLELQLVSYFGCFDPLVLLIPGSYNHPCNPHSALQGPMNSLSSRVRYDTSFLSSRATPGTTVQGLEIRDCKTLTPKPHASPGLSECERRNPKPYAQARSGLTVYNAVLGQILP